MRLHLITVGEPRLPYARAGWDEYWTRLGRYHKPRVTRVPGTTPEKEGVAILRAAGHAPLVALDPRGRQMTSEELSAFLDGLAVGGTGELALCVGGPDGLSDGVRARAHSLWSLSKLTFPHDLAMVVLLEALYRASTISKGEPYHR
ncbi:23S rRNA (pseudouridine(1915)-N(3))-methyltransferase RlmH [Deinococcus pimensis]|uniref:23S rRNA (pseudouridine(1915)-N(3))-methyltransferase RlmH n=1 Tax=Deinococcus pimensis TaxID=309888 RepID=UPI0004833B57|nr:23S rRNA (pseudouridine(1915)-N(3))-methyltransferase RlmH [Deinococcus pimensis]